MDIGVKCHFKREENIFEPRISLRKFMAQQEARITRMKKKRIREENNLYGKTHKISG
jgi:hypothetical protein